jgi:hypothetical protein
MATLNAWIGRANRQRLELLQDGSTVSPGAVTRAQLKFGGHCLDTSGSDPIELVDSATVVEMQLGLTPNLSRGSYDGRLTIYDASHPEGIAWQKVLIVIGTWAVCE